MGTSFSWNPRRCACCFVETEFTFFSVADYNTRVGTWNRIFSNGSSTVSTLSLHCSLYTPAEFLFKPIQLPTGSLVELPRNVAQQRDSLVTEDRTTVPVNDPTQNRYTLIHQNHSNHFQIIAILRTTIFGPKHNWVAKSPLRTFRIVESMYFKRLQLCHNSRTILDS